MDPLEYIETARLVIRPYRMDDLPQFCARFSDTEVTRYTGGVKSFEESRQSLERMIHYYGTNAPFGGRAIVLKADRRNIGYCGLNYLPDSESMEIEVFYGLNRDCWGKGFATEAAAAMVRHAFQDVGLEEVVAVINPQNTASRRVALRLSLRFRKHIPWPNQGTVELYGLSKAEYERRPGPVPSQST